MGAVLHSASGGSSTFVEHGTALLSLSVADVDPAEDGSWRRLDVEHHARLRGLLVVGYVSAADWQRFWGGAEQKAESHDPNVARHDMV